MNKATQKICVKVIPRSGEVIVFNTPKHRSSSIHEVIKYGTFVAIQYNEDRPYVNAENVDIPKDELADFSMARLVRLGAGKERASFEIHMKQILGKNYWQHSEQPKLAPPKPKPLTAPPRVVAAKPTPVTHALASVLEAIGPPAVATARGAAATVLDLIDHSPVVGSVRRSTVLDLIDKGPEKKLPLPDKMPKPDVMSKLRALAQDKYMRIIFESLANKKRDIKTQTAQSIICFIYPTASKSELKREHLKKFFIEMSSMGFGRFNPGPKGVRTNCVKLETMRFTWIDCSARAVSRYALDMPLVTGLPKGMYEAEASKIKQVVEPEVVVPVVEPEVVPVIQDDDLDDTPTLIHQPLSDHFLSNQKAAEEAAEEQAADMEHAEASGKLDNIAEVKAWLMGLSESGARGDTTLAWLTFHKLTNS
jgi:hypothetical protein